jgi:hypothetical protein
MRNWNQYLELWQQKRDELHVDIDAQADWSEMHDQLDKYLPVQNPGGGGANTGGQASNLGKQLSQLIKFKLFYVVGGLILAGAVTYSVMQHRAAIKNNKAVKTEVRKDSVATHNVSVTDSLSASNSNSAADSLGNHQNLPSDAAKSDDSKIGKDELRLAMHNKADASSIKNNDANSGSANNNRRILSSSNNLTNGLRLNSNGRSGSNTQLGNNSRRINVNSNNPAGLRRGLLAGNNYQNPEADRSGSMVTENNRNDNTPLLITAPATIALTWDDIVAGNKTYSTSLLAKLTRRVRSVRILGNPIEKTKVSKNATGNKKQPRSKNSTNSKNSIGSDLDWGILTGINSSGGFTSKAQNHNIYGSLSPDIYLGLFGTYNINDRWAVGLQGRFFTPHSISGSYNYTHKLTADTSHVTQDLGISDSRKIYTVDVPIYAIYKATPNISLKAGAILSMPVKQINGTNSFTISGPLRDSGVYYNSVTNDINASRFDKKIRVGASVGIGFAYKFLLLDATYNFQGQKVNSALGSYNANANSLQLTIGIKFNKSKK